ncbi:uncharacterized protein LOC111381660 [Olea europaea var. sylvestris]|uniref:uncharacterized protein LOC111381660 n=1 Tax=Olea europaea var. sylvestris TaxID=158386 RepID=UPI000C1CEC07|nr:uncharacterized protein LOC111381660 [Olea europaea var. sylvestris]
MWRVHCYLSPPHTRVGSKSPTPYPTHYPIKWVLPVPLWARPHGEVEDLAFITDRGQSIIKGIAEVFLKARHGYCMYHIQGNLKIRIRDKGIVLLFRRAIEAYSIKECNRYIVEIGSKSFPTWDYLTKMGIKHWLQQWFHDRRAKSHNCTNVLAPAQEKKLFNAAKVAKKLNVEPLDKSRFSVECPRNKAYMLESFSCEHAVAVTMYRGFAARTLYSPYYTSENWRVAYTETIFPLSNEIKWEVPNYIRPFNTVSPPLIEPRSPGCPSTSRISSTGEFFRPLFTLA